MRYRKGCHPNDLWTKYFTSSKRVKKLIALYGAGSFDAEIRKTFKTGSAALAWEQKVLRRLKIHIKEDWLNQALGSDYVIKGGPSHHLSGKPNLNTKPGWKHTDITKERMKGRTAWNKGLATPQDTRLKQSLSMKGKPKSPEHRAALIAAKKKR